MNLICRIWNDNTKRYGATFITCKKHYEMTSEALQKNLYNGCLEKIGESNIECEECYGRRPGPRGKEFKEK